MKSPCLYCSDRKLRCHSNCVKYLEWKKENEKRKNVAHEENEKFVFGKVKAENKVWKGRSGRF